MGAMRVHAITQAPTNRDIPAVEASGIARRFGSNWVLRGITLRVNRGEVLGLLGSNGTGKSTLLRVLATLLRPHAGSARVLGHDVVTEAARVRESVGYLAHSPALYDDLTALENLGFAADMLNRDRREALAALERVELSNVRDSPVRGFSSGMQRRLSIARLMLIRPSLLLLDEPYSNLDASGVELVNGFITELVGEGAAALVVIHEVAPALGILDRTLKIVDGRIAPHPSVDSSDTATRPRLARR